MHRVTDLQFAFGDFDGRYLCLAEIVSHYAHELLGHRNPPYAP
jgi:hypothetical protein